MKSALQYLGDGPGMSKEAKILNRKLCCHDGVGISCEAVEINWYSSHARHFSMWFGKFFLRRTMSTQHWSRVVKLQVSTSGELAVECISGETWIQ